MDGGCHAETLRILPEIGALRLFAVRVTRLGRKVALSLEELSPDSLAPLFVAALSATEIEEADSIVPRLVDAVLDRKPVEVNARIRSVTAQEARAFLKKPSDRFWVIGIPLSPVGFALSRMHEGENWRMGISLETAGTDDDGNGGRGFFGIEGAWVPEDGNVSPYLGAGLGLVFVDMESEGGGKLGAGMEFFRLHRVRVMLGVDLVVPFFDTPRGVYPSLTARLAF